MITSAYISFTTESGSSYSGYVSSVDQMTAAILANTQNGNDKIKQFTYTGHGFTDAAGLSINSETGEFIEPTHLAPPSSQAMEGMDAGTVDPSIGYAMNKSFSEGVDIVLNACGQGNYLSEYLDNIGPTATIHGYTGLLLPIGPLSWENVLAHPHSWFSGEWKTLTE